VGSSGMSRDGFWTVKTEYAEEKKKKKRRKKEEIEKPFPIQPQ
jgi:hypothetical protein